MGCGQKAMFSTHSGKMLCVVACVVLAYAPELRADLSQSLGSLTQKLGDLEQTLIMRLAGGAGARVGTGGGQGIGAPAVQTNPADGGSSSGTGYERSDLGLAEALIKSEHGKVDKFKQDSNELLSSRARAYLNNSRQTVQQLLVPGATSESFAAMLKDVIAKSLAYMDTYPDKVRILPIDSQEFLFLSKLFKDINEPEVYSRLLDEDQRKKYSVDFFMDKLLRGKKRAEWEKEVAQRAKKEPQVGSLKAKQDEYAKQLKDHWLSLDAKKLMEKLQSKNISLAKAIINATENRDVKLADELQKKIVSLLDFVKEYQHIISKLPANNQIKVVLKELITPEAYEAALADDQKKEYPKTLLDAVKDADPAPASAKSLSKPLTSVIARMSLPKPPTMVLVGTKEPQMPRSRVGTKTAASEAAKAREESAARKKSAISGKMSGPAGTAESGAKAREQQLPIASLSRESVPKLQAQLEEARSVGAI